MLVISKSILICQNSRTKPMVLRARAKSQKSSKRSCGTSEVYTMLYRPFFNIKSVLKIFGIWSCCCSLGQSRRRPYGHGGETPSRWAIFVIFQRKYPFRSLDHILHVFRSIKKTKLQKFQSHLKELNCSATSLPPYLLGQVQNTF